MNAFRRDTMSWMRMAMIERYLGRRLRASPKRGRSVSIRRTWCIAVPVRSARTRSARRFVPVSRGSASDVSARFAPSSRARRGELLERSTLG